MNQLFKNCLIASFCIALLTSSVLAQQTARIPLDWEPHPADKSLPVVCWDGCYAKIVKLIGGHQIRDRELATGLSRQDRGPAPNNTAAERRFREPSSAYPVRRTLTEQNAPATVVPSQAAPPSSAQIPTEQPLPQQIAPWLGTREPESLPPQPAASESTEQSAPANAIPF